MGGMIIEDPEKLYRTASNSLRNNRELESKIYLPEDVEMIVAFTTNQGKYSVSFDLISELNKFSGYANRLKKQFEIRNLPRVFEEHGEAKGFLRKKEENFYQFGITLNKVDNCGQMRLFCGQNGTFIPSLVKKSEFIKNLEEIEEIANILYFPFTKANGKKSSPSYFLDFALSNTK